MPKPIFVFTLFTLALAPALRAQQPPTADVAVLSKQAQQLESDGKRKEALVMFRQIVTKDPANVAAHLGVGRVLDLEGQYAEARQHLQKAIDGASETEINGALSTMAISYVFEGRTAEAATYYERLFNRQISAGLTDPAGGTANGLGRVYLETGDTANAETWYRTGYESAMNSWIVGLRTPYLTCLLARAPEHHVAARRA